MCVKLSVCFSQISILIHLSILNFFLRGIGTFKTYATLQFCKIYKKPCLLLAKDYLNISHVRYSLFSILLFLNTHACTLLHIHKRRGFHQSSGRQHVESLNVLLAKYRGEGGTHQAAHNERDWLQLIHIYTSTSYDPLLSGTTAVFRDTSRFYQPGRSQSINHLPKLNSMFSSVLANRTTAIRLQLLKYDKNFFQTVVAVLWGLTDMSFTVFLLYESFRPLSGHCLPLYQITNSPS